MIKCPYLIVVVCFLLFLPKNGYAYIDPGTGSFIFQMLIASILGAVLTIKLWWGAVKNFFRTRFGKTSPDSDKPTPSESSEK